MIAVIPQTLLQETKYNKFVWSGKRARIKISVLQGFIADGGLTLPNIRSYYYAAMISAVVQWWNH